MTMYSCSKKMETSDLTETYHSSEIVHSANGLDVVFQNIVSAPDIKIPTSITNVRSFPYTYLNVEGSPMKIIKITRDGNTLDLLIDKPNNTTAYIIERPEDINSIPSNTNAVYSVDRYQAKLYPVDQTKNISMVSFSLQNRNFSKKALSDIEMYLEDQNGVRYNFDHYISESLMTCEYPEYLKKNDIYPLRYLCLLPSDLDRVYLYVDGIKFEWSFSEEQGT